MQQQKQPEPTAAQTVEQTDSSTDFQRLLTQTHRPVGVFETPEEFRHAQRVAMMLVESNMVPESFRGKQNLGSAVVAVDIAFRLKLSPVLVMQQIYFVHGKPGWSAQFMIAVMNMSADFGKLRYDRQVKGQKSVPYSYTAYEGGQKTRKTGVEKIDDVEVTAWALEGDDKLPVGVNSLAKAREAGLPILEGTPVSIEMSIRDGWYNRADSKWKTMPEHMLRFRAATFFARLNAPELLMGLPTVDELEDTEYAPVAPAAPIFKTTPPVAERKVEPTAVPEPKQEPKQEPILASKTVNVPAPKLSKAPAAKSPENGVVAELRNLCAGSDIGQGALLDFLVSIGSVDGSICSLEEIHLSNPSIIPMVIEQWDDMSLRIKEGK